MLAACGSNPAVGPEPDRTTLTLSQPRQSKVDILFVVDNTNLILSTALKAGFDRFLQPFDALAQQGSYPDLHIGVVTTDYGAGATGAPGCSPSSIEGGGDQGKLIPIGESAAANCRKPKRANYIEYAYGPDLPLSNLPDGQSLLDTFACMASVGANGCGFEHTLESAYAALHNNIVANQGFLRADARLAVFFVTNEDDGSAPPDTDVFDKNKVAQYGYENSYSRQTRFGVVCGDPPALPPYGDSNGPLANCRPAPNPDGVSGPGKLFDVTRYTDFFALPRIQGGVKDGPFDVLLFAVSAPEEPFQVILANPGLPIGQPYVPSEELNEARNPPCVPVLQRSCGHPRNANFYGDPAVRLNHAVRSTAFHRLSSVCDDDFGPALDAAGRLVTASLDTHLSCIEDGLALDENGDYLIDCRVQDITRPPGGSERAVSIPRCDDPLHPDAAPCWLISPTSACAWNGGLAFAVQRDVTNNIPDPPPPDTTTRVDCVTQASR